MMKTNDGKEKKIEPPTIVAHTKFGVQLFWGKFWWAPQSRFFFSRSLRRGRIKLTGRKLLSHHSSTGYAAQLCTVARTKVWKKNHDTNYSIRFAVRTNLICESFTLQLYPFICQACYLNSFICSVYHMGQTPTIA